MLLVISCTTSCGIHPVREDDADDKASIREWRTRDERVVANMRDTQMAAEHYAADHGHCNYPQFMDPIFKTYFPGGVEGQTPSPVGPANPFNGHNEWPRIGHSITSVQEAREGKISDKLEPGEIQYTPLKGGQSYAIIAADHSGKLLMDPTNEKNVLVLSNE